MKTEIEAKFLNISHSELRTKLIALGATMEQPMRMMRRVVIHTPEMTARNSFVRIRDEGNCTTMTYKQFDSDSIEGAKEHEVEVSDFDTAIAIFAEAGLKYDTLQESRRENWRLGDVEIMLDEWPWLESYIEIEGPSEDSIRRLAKELGLEWSKAIYGGIANAYLDQYPHIGEQGVREINQNWPIIKFSDPKPELLTKDL